jgi:hypothetical protein
MIMKNTLIFFCLTFTVLTNSRVFGQATNLPAQFGPHLWTATVKVVGEDGNPIAGAAVSAQYDVPTPPNSDQQTFGEVKGVTDSNGVSMLSHTDSSWNLGIGVENAGYYPTHVGYEFYFDEKRQNPSFTLLLKKIGKPIPMYAKLISSEPSIFKKWGRPPISFTNTAAYDFMAGDWIAPCGKGQHTDIVFIEEYNKKSSSDIFYKLTVKFPNDGDGIQAFSAPALIQNATMGQSNLRSLHEAPVDGYQSEFVQTRGPDLNRNYYFRVQTVKDHDGNIVSAHYGKIYGDFMQFSYYLNPTPNDRNIEFDPKQNLIHSADDSLNVSAP